jgi:hypothetical protein
VGDEPNLGGDWYRNGYAGILVHWATECLWKWQYQEASPLLWLAQAIAALWKLRDQALELGLRFLVSLGRSFELGQGLVNGYEQPWRYNDDAGDDDDN